MNIVSIAGVADADYSGYPVTTVSILRIGALLTALRANRAQDLVIAGHARRPDLRSFNVDWGFVRHFFTILALTRGGDDRVLRKIAAFFERHGMTLRSISDVAPELLTPTGNLAGTVSGRNHAVADDGLRLIHELGPFDVGQAAIADANGAIAIEGAEGTNGLIERTRCSGSADDDRVLIKAAKPEQDLRLDLPTIGPETVARCANAGIKTIALEAGRSLILSRAETLRDAGDTGIAIVGLETPHDVQRIMAGGQPAEPVSRLRNLTRAVARPGLVRDAHKGLQLLSAASNRGVSAALVARENIIAINLNETLIDFIARTERLGQWGDRRQKTKRNRTLILSSVPDLETSLFARINQSKIAGIAVLDTACDPAILDQWVDEADARTLFVLSPE